MTSRISNTGRAGMERRARPFESSCGCSQPTSERRRALLHRGVVRGGERGLGRGGVPTGREDLSDFAAAPSALYKLGYLAEQRGDKAAARTYYARVIAGYPRSPEANLARDKLQRLGGSLSRV